MKQLSNWMRGWLMLAVVIACSMFTVPAAMASTGPLLKLSGIHVEKFKPREQPNYWLAGLGTIAAGARSSKKIRELQQQKAAKTDEANALLAAAAEDGDRDLTDAEQTRFDALVAESTALDKKINNEIAVLGLKADDADNGRHIPAVAHERAEDDAKRGFHSFGEFAKAVRIAGQPHGAVDQRLTIGAAAPGTYSQESIGADGGFAVPPAFSSEIWKMSLGEGSLLPYTANTEIAGNSMVFPKDETTPWGTSGVQAYWRNEGPALTGSKLALSTESLRLHELTVLVPVTNELLDDAPALGSYIAPLASDRIMWKTNEAILFGTGAGQPLGALSGSNNALIVVAKESGQAANTISQPNISKMRSRLLTGNLSKAIWVGNPDILPALEGLTVGNIPIFLPPGTGIRENYDGTLNGRPLILSEHASAFSSQGDLMLLGLQGYRTITKAGGIQTDTSMHIYFDANATAFRFIFRIDGKPILSAPVSTPKGNTRSYFVALGAR